MARYQGSIWRPTTKFGYPSATTHTKGVKRVIIHSAEGYRSAMFGVLDGSRQASWHFSMMQNGEVYQHINTSNIAWTAGSFEANDGSIQFEEEGKKGEALTSPQYVSTIALLDWVFEGYNIGEPNRSTNLREHNEFSDTSCPSNRIPWTQLIEDLIPVEENVTKETEMVLIRVDDGRPEVYSWGGGPTAVHIDRPTLDTLKAAGVKEVLLSAGLVSKLSVVN